MKKFRFQSVIGIVFIYLFFVNLILLIFALLTADIGFTIAAIGLSLIQLLLYSNFRSIRLVQRYYQVSEKLIVFNSLKFKVLVKSRNSKVKKYQQRELINERATNKQNFVAIGSFSNPGYMEYERVRCAGKAVQVDEKSLVVSIGTAQCTGPYASNIFNIGALSRETASSQALFALSEDEKIGGFSINTGEDGISPYHIRGGGDPVWQIDPNYAGCSYADGTFNEQLFKKNACAYEKLSDVQVRDFYRRTHNLRTSTLEDIYFGDGMQYNNKKNLLTSLN